MTCIKYIEDIKRHKAQHRAVTMHRASGTLFRRLSDQLTVMTPSRPG